MTKARFDGLLMVLLGSVVFLLLGALAESGSPSSMLDFKVIYYGARTLLHHHDPYNKSEVLHEFIADGGVFPSAPIPNRLYRDMIPACVNLPATLAFAAPLAMLPLGPAHLLWMALIAGCLIVASLLIWEIGAGSAPVLSGVLIGLLIANSEVILMMGNAAGIVVGLCAAAVWCFLRERFVPAGILLLAVSLAIKPHDAGLVWLYFLLAGGVYRKRALWTLLATAVISLPGLLWVWKVAPNWMQEWRTILSWASMHGNLADPALAANGIHAMGMMINLQTVISYFRDDPRFYDPVSYLICAPILLVWGIVTLRSRSTSASAWLALASIAALTMLPNYHRPYDAKLLLLTILACALLWREGGLIRWFALGINLAALVLTGDLVWIVLIDPLDKLHLSATGVAGGFMTGMYVFATPMILLAMSLFYLWAYQRRAPLHAES